MANATKGYFQKNDSNIGVLAYKEMLRILKGSIKSTKGRDLINYAIDETCNFDNSTVEATKIVQNYVDDGFQKIVLTTTPDDEGDAIGVAGRRTMDKCYSMMMYYLNKMSQRLQSDTTKL